MGKAKLLLTLGFYWQARPIPALVMFYFLWVRKEKAKRNPSPATIVERRNKEVTPKFVLYRGVLNPLLFS